LQKKIILKKIFLKNFKSIQNLKKLNQDINFITNFGRDVEYYTGIVFEVFSGKKKLLQVVVMMIYLKV
jgi:histidyl-tRNA synthetase